MLSSAGSIDRRQPVARHVDPSSHPAEQPDIAVVVVLGAVAGE
jgi:hypothetical protein